MNDGRPARDADAPANGADRAPGDVAPPGARILIVEDEPEFAGLLQLWLEHSGWSVRIARDGVDALRSVASEPIDLVLLDVSLPRLDGWGVIERIRATSRVPVLMVTARGAEADKVRGLRSGADDYITKPLSFPELIARVEAALRRARATEPDHDEVLRFGSLAIDPVRHQTWLAGAPVHLTPTEFRLLHHLAQRPGELVGHRDLLQAVWGPAYGDEAHLLRVTMRNLRMKLTAALTEQRYIVTVYGLGYRFEP